MLWHKPGKYLCLPHPTLPSISPTNSAILKLKPSRNGMNRLILDKTAYRGMKREPSMKGYYIYIALSYRSQLPFIPHGLAKQAYTELLAYCVPFIISHFSFAFCLSSEGILCSDWLIRSWSLRKTQSNVPCRALCTNPILNSSGYSTISSCTASSRGQPLPASPAVLLCFSADLPLPRVSTLAVVKRNQPLLRRHGNLRIPDLSVRICCSAYCNNFVKGPFIPPEFIFRGH